MAEPNYVDMAANAKVKISGEEAPGPESQFFICICKNDAFRLKAVIQGSDVEVLSFCTACGKETAIGRGTR